MLLPEYATAAFNLNDNKRVSNIVETDDGYHIIQLIEKRGDRINTRHILLRPKVSDKDLTDALTRLDSVRSDILAGKHTFDQMALYISQDKDSRNNNGNMLNEKSHSSRFEMADLPAEVGKKVYTMQAGDVSEPFVMVNPKTRREQVAMVKLVKRIDGHKADLADDYMIIKEMCEAQAKEEGIQYVFDEEDFYDDEYYDGEYDDEYDDEYDMEYEDEYDEEEEYDGEYDDEVEEADEKADDKKADEKDEDAKEEE